MPNAIPSRKKQDKLSEIATNSFPYLDLEFFWNADIEMEFQVNQKTNQKLKYLNKESTHTNAAFNAIPSSILNRLDKIFSRTKKESQIGNRRRILSTFQGVNQSRPSSKDIFDSRRNLGKSERFRTG